MPAINCTRRSAVIFSAALVFVLLLILGFSRNAAPGLQNRVRGQFTFHRDSLDDVANKTLGVGAETLIFVTH